MNKPIIALSALILFAVPAFAGGWTALNGTEEPYTIQVLESGNNSTVLNFKVNGYYSSKITIGGDDYLLMQKPRKESMIEEKGSPRLPRINRSIIIPDDGIMDWQVTSSEYIDIKNVDLAPSKGHFSRKIDPATVPYTFSDIYQQDAFFPGNLVKLREPYIQRDYRGIVVEVNAFQYNPVSRTLRIYTDITVEITKVAPGGENVLVRTQPLEKVDRDFHKYYKRHFLNTDNLDYTHLFEIGDMLVICYDDFMDDMQPFVDWKNQKGIPTTLVPVSEAGSNTTQVKNYIRDCYETTDLVFVLLVGDAAQVPAWSTGSDPVYSLLNGSDSYPEIFVGRFSAENSDHVITQVERTITYEKYPDPAGNWYHMGLGDADESGPTNHEQYDFQHITNIANKLVHWNYSQVDSVYTTFGGTTQMIADFLNDGTSILNYAGHGWWGGMGPVNFTNSDVNNLVNDNMLPHLVTIACDVGSFANHTCFGETWQRATNALTGAPTGAIANYTSKISQTWFPPYDMQDEGIDLLVRDSVQTFGAMCFNGSGLMIDLWPLGDYEFKNWTIFGDPSVQLRSMTPYYLNVTHDDTIEYGQSTFEVTVEGIEGALAAISHNGELLGHAYTNSSGLADIEITGQIPQGGYVTLTATSYNSMPYIVEIPVSASIPNMTIELTYLSGSPVPPGGGYLSLDLYLDNLDPNPVNFDLWIAIEYEGGTPTTLAQRNLTFPAGHIINRPGMNWPIPAGWAAGDYMFWGRVGIEPNLIWDESGFPFVKDGATAVGGFTPWMPEGAPNPLDDIFGDIERGAYSAPAEFALLGVYPNPFNPIATIRYQLPVLSQVNLMMYDIHGRLVAELLNAKQIAGTHDVTFDASSLASGIYIYHLDAGEYSTSGKLILMK